MVTLKEIAQMCGVTTSTVSNVLNNKPKVGEATRKKVLEAVEKTGYQPNYFAQVIRKAKTNVIGIVTEDLNEFSTTPLVEAIMAYCEDHGYRTILENLRFYDKWSDTWYTDRERQDAVRKPALTSLLSIKVDGVIYVAGHCRVIECFPEDFPVPGIVLYGFSACEKFPSVILDDEKGGYDMTRYLMSMGHRSIGVIAGRADNIHTQKRLMGYQRALYEAGVLYNPAIVRFGDWKRDAGYAEAGALAKAGVSCIFCMNDRMAAGAYDWFHDNGKKVGEEISVVGYDNIELADYIRPHLTTMDMHLTEVGRMAAERLLGELEGDTGDVLPSIVKVAPEMIIRDSVRRLTETKSAETKSAETKSAGTDS